MTDFFDIQQLVKLFNPKNDDDSDSDNSDTQETTQNFKVEDEPKQTKPNPYSKIEQESKEDNAFGEFTDTENYLPPEEKLSSDWKKTPKWDISYRQKVSASDVFLQIGAKTPSTASCEDMIVSIDLPGEHMQNIDIKVYPKELAVTSPNFSLNIPLPQPVHPQKGDAKWDKDNEKLIVTLRMEREFDFVNF